MEERTGTDPKSCISFGTTFTAQSSDKGGRLPLDCPAYAQESAKRA
jgi:hypothetical protein